MKTPTTILFTAVNRKTPTITTNIPKTAESHSRRAFGSHWPPSGSLRSLGS